MAAKPHRDFGVVVHCPPTTPYGSHGEASSMAQAEGSGRRIFLRAVCCILIAGIAAVIITGVVVLGVEIPDEAPKYSVAVTAVAGLDPARELTARSRPTLSPVLNVTVRIDNTRNAFQEACISDLGKEAAEVSYGDAFLGRGTVPQFCARRRRGGERVARAWGEDVVVPWFLRDELAAELAVGEATVDVQLMPSGINCRAKIGKGLSRCGVPE
ncbi:hypothetical protein SETIT_7G161600v2 [Setaria italica]|uniref:Late embryogenesis abundant protein LEA-2 subgroup domain-containing protein n=1 Tax=Setaria italica TaxID=4555 RepID=K3YCG2_SETIT|nr:hypothetical protein SETIT_7G161600v2 [Setaria italica]